MKNKAQVIKFNPFSASWPRNYVEDMGEGKNFYYDGTINYKPFEGTGYDAEMLNTSKNKHLKRLTDMYNKGLVESGKVKPNGAYDKYNTYKPDYEKIKSVDKDEYKIPMRLDNRSTRGPYYTYYSHDIALPGPLKHKILNDNYNLLEKYQNDMPVEAPWSKTLHPTKLFSDPYNQDFLNSAHHEAQHFMRMEHPNSANRRFFLDTISRTKKDIDLHRKKKDSKLKEFTLYGMYQKPDPNNVQTTNERILAHKGYDNAYGVKVDPLALKEDDPFLYKYYRDFIKYPEDGFGLPQYGDSFKNPLLFHLDKPTETADMEARFRNALFRWKPYQGSKEDFDVVKEFAPRYYDFMKLTDKQIADKFKSGEFNPADYDALIRGRREMQRVRKDGGEEAESNAVKYRIPLSYNKRVNQNDKYASYCKLPYLKKFAMDLLPTEGLLENGNAATEAANKLVSEQEVAEFKDPLVNPKKALSHEPNNWALHAMKNLKKQEGHAKVSKEVNSALNKPITKAEQLKVPQAAKQEQIKLPSTTKRKRVKASLHQPNQWVKTIEKNLKRQEGYNDSVQ